MTTDPVITHLATECLGFARAVVERHVANRSERARLLSLLDDTARRIEDPNLYVAVLGESSGKTTLINALLHANLFPTGVRPVTDAAVRIEAATDAPGFSFRLGGSAGLHVPCNDSALSSDVTSALREAAPGRELPPHGRALLRELTEHRAWRGLVDELRVRWRAPALDKGVVVIDTPGSNADVTAHVRVATDVVADEADGTIVVVSSHIQITESLARFLGEVVPPPVLQRCLVLVTRMDDLDDKKQCAQVLKAVRTSAARGRKNKGPCLSAHGASCTSGRCSRFCTTRSPNTTAFWANCAR